MSAFKSSDNDEVDAESDIEDEEEPVKVELHPSDFYFGMTLGEGAYARVVHAKSKRTNEQFAVKIMEKVHIKKENKVRVHVNRVLQVVFEATFATIPRVKHIAYNYQISG